ncbi:hypothetical protein FOZ61_000605 [Perkinsus olseni]|uniref:Uncharacterized protein n=1 Tax=Perkinsus olseni TaxID=32597 RepID=A0A7J6LZG9_PEROL|nr:hypothetical protein FOZ61_000605 [Perkinsus olseni]KAF4673441.1 hypothetical protein FOL46_007230 [Perkinsus olseni]
MQSSIFWIAAVACCATDVPQVCGLASSGAIGSKGSRVRYDKPADKEQASEARQAPRSDAEEGGCTVESKTADHGTPLFLDPVERWTSEECRIRFTNTITRMAWGMNLYDEFPPPKEDFVDPMHAFNARAFGMSCLDFFYAHQERMHMTPPVAVLGKEKCEKIITNICDICDNTGYADDSSSDIE